MIRIIILIVLLSFSFSCIKENSKPIEVQALATYTVTCYCDHFFETCICAGRVYKLHVQAEVEEMPEL
jgi:hypothetical protein